MPFMHVHEHHHDCHHGHGHDEGEPLHSDEKCPACVFINTHVDFNIQPTTIPACALCYIIIPHTEVYPKDFSPITNIQSRAPPIFSD